MRDVAEAAAGFKENKMQVADAWKEWWQALGHVARCNRDIARTREAFEAGYAAGRSHVGSPRLRETSVYGRSGTTLGDSQEPRGR